jgi:hypothetical protein
MKVLVISIFLLFGFLKLSNEDAKYITISHFNVLPEVKHTKEVISLVMVLFRAV